MVTTGGEETDVAEIAPEPSMDLLRMALKFSTAKSVMFCWMMAVEAGLAVVATSRRVFATPRSRLSNVITTSSGGLR